ncbi:MAG TPA: hypothetical protein PLU16_06285 [Gallionellaceae bacterium]|jgi:hypothetical protein|nr:hypothetical protein [Gallionellaceae bacterium]HQS74800.1 hypothetical protein [Gallionellaceae bacterium]
MQVLLSCVRYQTERTAKRGDDAHGFLVLPLIKDLQCLGPDAVTPHPDLFIDRVELQAKLLLACLHCEQAGICERG